MAPPRMRISQGLIQCDVLVVGSGAAGLAAAATADGLDVLLIDSQPKLGGTSFLSGGTMWMPHNFLLQGREGIADSHEQGRRYMLAGIRAFGGVEEASSLASRRIDSFLSQGSQMIDCLRAHGFKWMDTPSSFPDYHPELDGALGRAGRTLDPAIVDQATLGTWKSYLPVAGSQGPLICRFADLRFLTRPLASLCDLIRLCWAMLKSKAYSMVYDAPVSMGQSLIVQLLAICRRNNNVRISTNTRLMRLFQEQRGGRVTGGLVTIGKESFAVRASCGVLLATGGAARDQQHRDAHLRATSKDWSLTAAGGDQGDAIRLGRSVGAASALLGEVWGIPTMEDIVSRAITEAMFAMSKPFSIAVNSRGKRFCAESSPYGDIVRSMYAQEGDDPRAWLVLDRNYRRRYSLGRLQPWQSATGFLRPGSFLQAFNIEDLEKQMGVPEKALQDTVARWNAMCVVGKDEDYGRGEGCYQQLIGDPAIGGNLCMGKIARAPFYAVRIFPGDAGTKGGLVVDEHARVQSTDGNTIHGLYAAGNASASVFGHGSLGAGITLCPAMKDGFVAVRHMLAQRAK